MYQKKETMEKYKEVLNGAKTGNMVMLSSSMPKIAMCWCPIRPVWRSIPR
jgi:hypothetical protein